MSDKINILQAQLTPGQKNNLLSVYEDYMFYTRKLEDFIKRFSVKSLALYQFQVLYDDLKNLDLLWKIEYMTPKEQQHYQDFIYGYAPQEPETAYISLQHTNPQNDNSEPIDDLLFNVRKKFNSPRSMGIFSHAQAAVNKRVPTLEALHPITQLPQPCPIYLGIATEDACS